MTQYMFLVSPRDTSPYIETYNNTEQYWKTVGEMKSIIEARVPSGASVTFYGTN